MKNYPKLAKPGIHQSLFSYNKNTKVKRILGGDKQLWSNFTFWGHQVIEDKESARYQVVALSLLFVATNMVSDLKRTRSQKGLVSPPTKHTEKNLKHRQTEHETPSNTETSPTTEQTQAMFVQQTSANRLLHHIFRNLTSFPTPWPPQGTHIGPLLFSPKC